MRVPTFSFLSLLARSRAAAAPVNRLYRVSSRSSHTLSTAQDQPADVASPVLAPECVEIAASWPSDAEAERAAVLRDMTVTRGFMSQREEHSLVAELEPYLRKMRYEYDHWDDAIHGFRETERRAWSPENREVLARVVGAAFPPGADALEHTHVLDLAAQGVIKPHVDAVRFCGRVIAGVCLLSDAVMRLVHTVDKRRALDILLPRRSLYIMKDTARYDYTHEILAGDASAFRGRAVPRARRISVICRSGPEPERQA